MSALNSLDDYLAYRTYLVGHDITAADWVVWGALKGAYLLEHLLPRQAESNRVQVTSKSSAF